MNDFDFAQKAKVRLLISDISSHSRPRQGYHLAGLLPQLLALKKRTFVGRNMEDIIYKHLLAHDVPEIQECYTSRVSPYNTVVVTWTPTHPPRSRCPRPAQYSHLL